MARKKTPITTGGAAKQSVQDDDRPRAPLPPLAYTLDSSDPVVRGCLDPLASDPAAAGVLADLLEECGDPRAEPARELADASCVVPGPLSGHSQRCALCVGSWFEIRLRGTVLIGVATWGGQSHSFVERFDSDGASMHAPLEVRTEASVGEAFERMRCELIRVLMETPEQLERDRRAVLTNTSAFSVACILSDYEPSISVPWALELRDADPDRFRELIREAREHDDLNVILVDLLEALRPGLLERVLLGEE